MSQDSTIDSDKVWDSAVQSVGDIKWMLEMGIDNNNWNRINEDCAMRKLYLQLEATASADPVKEKKDF